MDIKALQAATSRQRVELQSREAEYRQAAQVTRTLEARMRALDAAVDASPEARIEMARELRHAQGWFDEAEIGYTESVKQLGGIRTPMFEIAPQDAVTACDDHLPFLLLPVRLECRLVSAAGELQLRIFPDRISVDSLDELLTTEEIAAAETFWTDIWRAGGDIARELGAWRALVQAFGTNRAAWIVRTHGPLNETGAGNVSNRPPQPLEPGDLLNPAPQFEPTVGRLDSWSRAPRAMGLPDRFVAIGYVGGDRIFEQAGAAIPETLFTGPDPLSDDPNDPDPDVLSVDRGMKWMVDFDEAVAVGMGMRIALPPSAISGVEELVVLGVRASATPAEGEGIVETILRTHLHGPEGLSIVPRGTPTNDTSAVAAPAAPEPGADAIYMREFRRAAPALFGDWRDKTDGDHLATALGIDPALVRPVANADGHDQVDAHAMNVALWPATMGAYLEEMAAPLVKFETTKLTERFFTTHVSGRGPVPTIRVGDQPYGVLVTSAMARWTPAKVPLILGHGPLVEDHFRTGLYALLMRLDSIWATLAQAVPTIGSGADPQGVLMSVLGLQPCSAEYYQRFAVSADQIANAQNLYGSSSFSNAMARIMEAQSQEMLHTLGIMQSQTPEIYHKIFFNSAKLQSGPFVDGLPPSETHLLEPLSEWGENYLQWLATGDVDTVRREDFGHTGAAAILAPKALLYILLRQAILNAYFDAGWNFLDTAELANQVPRFEFPLVNIQSQSDSNGSTAQIAQTKYGLLYQNSDRVTQAHPELLDLGSTMAEIISNPFVITTRPESAQLHAVRQACDWLSTRPTAVLTRAFAEHTDLCSYRLDAWQLGLVNERLATLRAAPATKAGTYVGAFGYLEWIKRKSPPGNHVGQLPPELQPTDPSQPTREQAGAQHILAPSLNHAVTAAVLRSAYLTHATAQQPGTLAVDISSTRVRRALDILDGIRNGQGLAELLGYQFEGGMHDRHADAEVDKFIYPLRAKFPLASGQQIATPPGTPITAVEARNVIDGRQLVLHVQALADRSYPFGFADLPGASDDEKAAINAEVDTLTAVLDGVSDLLLADSAYSAALGNFERAGAALDSLSGVENIPDPDILRTRRTGHGLTHRLCLVVPGGRAESETRLAQPIAPRAGMEPELDAWLRDIFGGMENIYCRALIGRGAVHHRDVSLADAGIHPIDLLYMIEPGTVSAAGECDLRIAAAARRLQGVGDETPVSVAYATPVDGQVTLFELLPLVRAVKGLCLGRRYLGAADFVMPPPGPSFVDVDPPANPNGWDVDAYAARVTAAATILSNARTELHSAAASLQNTGAAIEAAWVRTVLQSCAGFGITQAFPATSTRLDQEAIADLLAQAARVGTAIAARLADYQGLTGPAATLDADAQVAQWVAAARTIFGADFVTMPPFAFRSPEEIAAGAAASTNLLRHVAATDPCPLDTWVAGLARVRETPFHLERILTLTQLFDGDEPQLTPLQLPYRANDYWLGMELPKDYIFDRDSLLATTIFASGHDISSLQAGLMFDEWTEVIPDKDHVAGVAFRFDAPGSEAPQSLLLAVTPEITGNWQWDDLVETVRSTIRMAKQRAVEPAAIDGTGLAQLLPAIMLPFTAVSTGYSADLIANIVANQRK